MSSDEDEETFEEGLSLGGLPPKPPRPRQKTFLKKLTIGRRKSTGQEFLRSTSTVQNLPTGSPAITDHSVPPQQTTRVSRSQSNANVHGFKVQWADALICQ